MKNTDVEGYLESLRKASSRIHRKMEECDRDIRAIEYLLQIGSNTELLTSQNEVIARKGMLQAKLGIVSSRIDVTNAIASSL